MKRRALFLVPLLPLLAPARARAAFTPTPQDSEDLARIETYLNSTRSLKAHFTQVASDGAVTQGTAWLVRPGRMRFQYDPPAKLLLVAGHGLVVFHDGELGQTSNIPAGQTPLGILLRDNLTLSGQLTVTAVTRDPGTITVTLYRTASPGDGTLALTFSDNPLQLRQWVVVDAQRRATRIMLSDIQLGGSYDDKLFEYIDPKAFGNGGTGSG
jgi:outer membrane lipoprotein-sorting protein